MKISIVMTYYLRPIQLLKTLESFRQYNPADFNVIIVDDNSPEDIEPLIKQLGLAFEVTIIKMPQKQWINPSPVAFNTGFSYAIKNGADIIILQNAECYHVGDILGYAKRVTDKSYISFGCYSLGKGEDITKRDFNNRGAAGNGDSAWYNHPVYRPEALHFCCAIATENLIHLNGFDESFSYGLGYEDDYFIHQVRCMGLQVEITAEPFVFHQYHYDIKCFNFDQDLYNQTGAMCNELKKQRDFRAKHYLTPDL
jgi:GT2 family glycosyltransferase